MATPVPGGDAGRADLEALIGSLAVGVVEVLAGARDLAQFAPWISDRIYRSIRRRQLVLVQSSRSARGAIARPALEVRSIITCSPCPGVVDGAVMLRGPSRSRAVVIRLERRSGRWRATAFGLL